MPPAPVPEAMDVPAVPGYAWDWLQRSRPVVDQLAEVLTGQPPRSGFVDAVRRSFPDDPLVRDAVLSVIATVAFRGRVPSSRPRGVSWDRGLVWWAAVLAGRSPQDYTAPPVEVDQPALFGYVPPPAPSERRALVAALRDLLAQRTGDQIPASAIRQLIAQLEHGSQDDGRGR
ncbi:MAG: hypothetical protein KY460_03870 [Actinobacteria bacterium]|nr:hypothetical protein [Actinomycetota bacterium]